MQARRHGCTTWLFSADPRRRVRSSMALLAVLLMLFSACILLWLAYSGVAPLVPVLWWSLCAVGGLAFMAALVRSGISEHWSDPALTFPQVLWGITASATAYVLVAEAKAVVHGALAVSLLFAALNLQAKQIIVVSLYAFGIFALAVGLLMRSDHITNLPLEIAYAGALLSTLVGCMLLSLRLHQLRMRLHNQRQALAAALEENRELASRDPLTGLLNRRHMLELLQLEQRRCMRGVRSMVLAQMDIDHFKTINDTYGHGVGDLALATFADVVRNNIRSSDVLARWGGEEFVLLLSDTPIDMALHTLTRVRLAIQNAVIDKAPPELRMTVSIGLAAHLPGEALEATLHRADQALYDAKRNGRNQVICAQPPTEHAEDAAAITAAMAP